MRHALARRRRARREAHRDHGVRLGQAQAARSPAQDPALREEFSKRTGPIPFRNKPGDGIVTPADFRKVRRRAGKAALQQTGAGARDGSVNRAHEASGSCAGKRCGQFQVAAGCGIDLETLAIRFPNGGAQQGGRAALRQLDIVGERTHCGKLRPRKVAIWLERGHPVELLQSTRRRGAVEAPGAKRSHMSAFLPEPHDKTLVVAESIREQRLARRDTRGHAGKHRAGAGRHPELTCREIDPGEGRLVPYFGPGGQEVVAPGLQERVLGEGAGREHPRHFPLHDRARAAAPGLLWILHLLADRHPVVAADQLKEIGLGTVYRHAAHRNVLAEMLAACGQRDVEGGGSLPGVIEEELVEVAHPIEKQIVRMLVLDRPVLPHHGRVGVCRHHSSPTRS